MPEFNLKQISALPDQVIIAEIQQATSSSPVSRSPQPQSASTNLEGEHNIEINIEVVRLYPVSLVRCGIKIQQQEECISLRPAGQSLTQQVL